MSNGATVFHTPAFAVGLQLLMFAMDSYFADAFLTLYYDHSVSLSTLVPGKCIHLLNKACQL